MMLGTERLPDMEEMYSCIENYAASRGWYQTLKVLPYARELHNGQYRKGEYKIPYICHPLLVSCHAISLGLEDDDLISTALLHDVCEDCGVFPEELPVNEKTRMAVELLTKSPSKSAEQYYQSLSENKIAIMVKLLDRCNNISGMSAAFSDEKMVSYIKQTEKWIYPLFHIAHTEYPEYSNQVFLIKYHMTSVIDGLKRRI